MLIIGDEILSGKVQDTNSPWVAKRCRSLGLELCRIVVLPDILDEIGAAVAEWSARCDIVFTSGGVGPTHDDLTMAGIARGLARPITRHPELLSVIQRHMGPRFTAASARMADIPLGAELWWDGELRFPQVVVGNVVVFPGVPSLLRLKFDAIAHRFGGTPVVSDRLVTTLGESDIAEALGAIQVRFPTVAIGSYPQFDQRPWTVTITMDASNTADLLQCKAAVAALIGAHVAERDPAAPLTPPSPTPSG
jgi:FAD synthetase